LDLVFGFSISGFFSSTSLSSLFFSSLSKLVTGKRVTNVISLILEVRNFPRGTKASEIENIKRINQGQNWNLLPYSRPTEEALIHMISLYTFSNPIIKTTTAVSCGMQA